MADADIIESQPMDLNDDDKDESDTMENGNVTSLYPSGTVVQVTNVSPGATLQQLATLFGFLGTVSDIRLYPTEETVPPVQVKVCYIKYENNEQCGVAQHLTNTVFIDKALIVVPINREELPEESDCKHLIQSINAYATLSTTGYLPSGFPAAEDEEGIPGLPPPPVITSSTDPVEMEEIRKTILVRGIDESVKSEQLMAFFSGVGEIKYIRLCNPPGEKYAFIEFTGPESVPTALQYNGVIFGGKCLKVEYSKSPVIKPESERIASGRNPHRSSRDVVKRPSSVNLRRSRSRSRSSARKRSRSRGRTSKARSRSGSKTRRQRSRSRSTRRRRSPSRSPPPRRRSRTRSRSRSRRMRRSPSRSRTKSPPRRRRPSRSRSRSRDRRRRKRSPSKSTSPSRRSRKKSKSKSRSPSNRRRSKKSGSKSPDRSKLKKKKSRDKDKEKEKEKDSKSKDKGKDKDKEKEGSDKEKDLKTLLDKVYSYEEGKEKEKSSKEKEKKEKEREKEKEKEKDREKDSSPVRKIKIKTEIKTED